MMVSGWILVMIFSIIVSLAITRIDVARESANPPRVAIELAGKIERAIARRPAATAHWLRLEEPHVHVQWVGKAADILAHTYLRAFGHDEEARWVDRLNVRRGPVPAVVLYPKGQPPEIPKEGVMSPAVLCLPLRSGEGWVGLFWDGPWANQKVFSAKVLEDLCDRHAPMAFEDLARA